MPRLWAEAPDARQQFRPQCAQVVVRLAVGKVLRRHAELAEGFGADGFGGMPEDFADIRQLATSRLLCWPATGFRIEYCASDSG